MNIDTSLPAGADVDRPQGALGANICRPRRGEAPFIADAVVAQRIGPGFHAEVRSR